MSNPSKRGPVGLSRQGRVRLIASVASVALMMPAITAPPSGLGFVSVAEAREMSPEGSNGAINADAIESGAVTRAVDLTNARRLLSGRAILLDGNDVNPLFAEKNNPTPIPSGVPVYAQWIDRDGAVSPVYVAHTHDLPGVGGGAGTYAFQFPSWFDSEGKERIFLPAAGGRVKWRVWVPPFVNENTGNEVTTIRQVSGFFPGAFSNAIPALGEWVTLFRSVQKTALIQYEKPGSYMFKGEPVLDSEGADTSVVFGGPNNSINGSVWKENGRGDQTPYKPAKRPVLGDEFAEGYEVVASSITPAGKEVFELIKTLPKNEQRLATKNALESNPEYISATRSAKVDENGRYTIRFEDGELDAGLMYVAVKDLEGNYVANYGKFSSPIFLPATNDQGVNPDVPESYAYFRNKVHNLNFALIETEYPQIRITNYDVMEDMARPGDTAVLELSSGKIAPQGQRIVWTDSEGREVKVCEDLFSSEDVQSCTFTVPENLKAAGSTYTASLYDGEFIVSADSFFAKPFPVDPTNEDPEIAPKNGVSVTEGEEVPSNTLLATISDDKEIDPRGISVSGLPEGVNWEYVENDEDPSSGRIILNGVPEMGTASETPVDVTVTVQDANGAEVSETIPVAVNPSNKPPAITKKDGLSMTEGQEVPAGTVLASVSDDKGLPEGAVEVSGLPEGVTAEFDAESGQVVLGGTPAEGSAQDDAYTVTVTVTDSDGESVEELVEVRVKREVTADVDPKYAENTVVRSGLEASSKEPTFVNPETGEPVTRPDGAIFALGELPFGVEAEEVSIDENTGVVTYRPRTNGSLAIYSFPVIVEYSDGSTDEVDANFDVQGNDLFLEASYDDVAAVVGEQKSSGPIKFANRDEQDPEVKVPENPRYDLFGKRIGDDGEQVDADNATIDPVTGAVTYTPKPEEGGKTVIFLVSIEYTGAEGDTDSIRVRFNVDKITVGVDPKYSDTPATSGESASSNEPRFVKPGTDEDVDKPAITSFAVGDSAPEGAEVSESGVVTYTPTSSEAGQTVDVPIVVTYADGSTDTVTVPFVV
ncbi:YPDG domain-containing protein, partial [Corynebacterium sp. CCM 9204]|uniref:YPDG domain-containing protein n=1 Tax=Corynebacterium sp. CCM 9204 TaxID=3057616 RepID=UPI003524AE5C